MGNNSVEIRPIEERDAENIVRWRNADEVRRNLFSQSLLTVEQHLNYFRTVVCTGKCRQYIISMKGNNEIDIGTVFLKNIDKDKQQAEFGIFIGEPKGRGRNCSLPATEEILRIAFCEMGLKRIYLFVVGDNEPAIKTYLRVGFHEIDREYGSFVRGSQSVDVIQMEITEKKWRQKRMSKIKVTPCNIEGLCVIEPSVFGDERGWFMETYNQNDMRDAGIDAVFVQDNQSMSRRGVLRGLHYQIKFPQAKLVRVISGEVFDVAVDLRPGSETYGKWHGEVLSAENKKQFFIPEGFAHGFYVLSETAEFCYKVTDFYHPGDEGGVRWNDPEIGVEWPLMEGVPVLLSEKDKVQPFLRELNE